MWASDLYDEVVPLGYPRSYPSFVRQVRLAGLRPHCEACSGVKGRATVEIDHASGEEIQWDWAERRRAPWGATSYGLLGTLSHSGRTRQVLSESVDQPTSLKRWTGCCAAWGAPHGCGEPDRLATVIVPGSADVQASFAPVAKSLRSHRRAVPSEAGEPQGRGRVRGEVHVRPVVAHDDGDQPRGRPGEPGPLLVHHRRRPTAPGGSLCRS